VRGRAGGERVFLDGVLVATRLVSLCIPIYCYRGLGGAK
jgi:hypothetical protein